jgi:hypothetical protein
VGGGPEGPGHPTGTNPAVDATCGVPEPDDGSVIHCRSKDAWTARYYRDRGIVNGRRGWLSQNPEVAAEQLADRAGGRERARRWAADVLAALDRGRPV